MNNQLIDITGLRFGLLTVIKRQGTDPKCHAATWLCRCDCGKEIVVAGIDLRHDLRYRPQRGCGCRAKKHGMHGTPEYNAYLTAKQRCTNPKDKDWKDYGGRGIKFLFTSFEQWLAELGRKPSLAHSIDRKDNDGNYEPGNVRWATREEQRANQRPRKKAA